MKGENTLLQEVRPKSAENSPENSSRRASVFAKELYPIHVAARIGDVCLLRSLLASGALEVIFWWLGVPFFPGGPK